MQVVEIITYRPFIAIERSFKTGVALSGCESGELSIIEEVNGVRGNNKVDKQAAEISDVFHRVHGHARPGCWIGVFMVKTVDGPEQRFPVQQAVNEIKMGFPPEGDDKKPGDEPDGIGCPGDKGGVPVGGGPYPPDFVSGPDGGTRDACEKDIVQNLILKEKLFFALFLPFRVVFAFFTLDFLHVEGEVIKTEYHPEKDQIAQEHQSDPAGGEFFRYREVGLEKIPGGCGQKSIADMSGPEQASPAEYPLKYLQGTKGPLEQGRVPAGIVGFPVSFLIVTAEVAVFFAVHNLIII